MKNSQSFCDSTVFNGSTLTSSHRAHCAACLAPGVPRVPGTVKWVYNGHCSHSVKQHFTGCCCERFEPSEGPPPWPTTSSTPCLCDAAAYHMWVCVCTSTTQPFSLIGSCRGLPRKPHSHTRVCVCKFARALIPRPVERWLGNAGKKVTSSLFKEWLRLTWFFLLVNMPLLWCGLPTIESL